MSDIIDFVSYRKSRLHPDDIYHERFGSWEDWQQGEILYLLHELANGFEFAEKVEGSAIIASALHLAIAIEDEGLSSMGAKSIINTMWAIADEMRSNGASGLKDAKPRETLDAIWTASCWSGGIKSN